jgi:hypothetical protein
MSGTEGILREEVEGSASIGVAHLLLRQNLIQFLAIADITDYYPGTIPAILSHLLLLP